MILIIPNKRRSVLQSTHTLLLEHVLNESAEVLAVVCVQVHAAVPLAIDTLDELLCIQDIRIVQAAGNEVLYGPFLYFRVEIFEGAALRFWSTHAGPAPLNGLKA
jgi:hypothetical protein